MPKVCSTAGCIKYAKSAGQCLKCGPKVLCTDEGCSKPQWKKGKCNLHSKRCSALGCTLQVKANKRCVTHGAHGFCKFCNKGVAKPSNTTCTACANRPPEHSVANIPTEHVNRAAGGIGYEGLHCTLKSLWQPLTMNPHLVMPLGLHHISPSLFANSSWLKDLEFPTGFRSTNDYNFQACVNLETVIFPASYQSSGNYTFDGCTSLTSVNFHPDTTLLTIGDHMFSKCSGLKSIAIPKSVTHIGDKAFAESGLLEACLPPTVTDCCVDAFAGCPNLTQVEMASTLTIWVDGCNPLPAVDPSKEVTLDLLEHTLIVHTPAPQHTLAQLRWTETWILSEVPLRGPADYILPQRAEHIGPHTFMWRKWLTNINLKGIKWIDQDAFYRCSNLSNLDLSTVEVIGPRAFKLCTSLVEVLYWGGGGRLGLEIEGEAFAGCSTLSTPMHLPPDAIIHPTAYDGCLPSVK